MAMGKRKPMQETLFVAYHDLPRSAGHPFYVKLNGLLQEAGFDAWLENRCVQYYAQGEKRGQPSIAPGVYFRMLLVGYFEGIDSQRGIAWRCADSLSLRQFLGVPLGEQAPDHSTLTNTRKRLPPEVFEEVFQFVLKMSIVIAVAYYAIQACGGMSAVIASLQQMQAHAGGNAENPLSFLPNFSRGITSEPTWMVPLANFFVFLGLQWWAFWYPGAEPGGGGYIAQRIFSARDEKQGLLSVLWFNIAHYAIRPWPWILTGVAVIVLYPGLAHPETGYMMVLNNYLPHQYRGIAIAGFLAAFMSTIATQLNWGASYLVSDFYRRFVNKDASENHYVLVSRLCTVLLVIVAAWVSVQLGSIASGWEIVLQVGAGTGAVYILRWYWWRINAWSEISAMACSLAISVLLSRWHPFSGNSSVVFAKGAIVTTIVTTVVWVAVTLLTRPEPQGVLTRFYRNVRPDVRGWQQIADLEPSVPQNRDLGRNLWAWALGCAMVYLCLFGTGKILLHQSGRGAILLFFSAMCAGMLYRGVVRNFADESEDAPGTVPDWVESPATPGH